MAFLSLCQRCFNVPYKAISISLGARSPAHFKKKPKNNKLKHNLSCVKRDAARKQFRLKLKLKNPRVKISFVCPYSHATQISFWILSVYVRLVVTFSPEN